MLIITLVLIVLIPFGMGYTKGRRQATVDALIADSKRNTMENGYHTTPLLREHTSPDSYGAQV